MNSLRFLLAIIKIILNVEVKLVHRLGQMVREAYISHTSYLVGHPNCAGNLDTVGPHVTTEIKATKAAYIS